MYVPEPFAWHDQDALWRALQADSFGLLIGPGRAGEPPLVSHLPFLAEPRSGRLLCHVARENPQWQAIQAIGNGAPVRCVFSGAHGYVSPTWYEKPDRAVPTWNYVAVHAIGTAKAVEDQDWLDDLVTRLSAEREHAEGWRPAMMRPAAYRAMLGAIVGIDIAVESLEGKRKLSQNRSPVDQLNVAAALAASEWPGDHALAEEMAREQGQAA
ncbi:MAG: FMN-binding negative transcriptional regulator [Pseudomonadota bacterium]